VGDRGVKMKRHHRFCGTARSYEGPSPKKMTEEHFAGPERTSRKKSGELVQIYRTSSRGQKNARGNQERSFGLQCRGV